MRLARALAGLAIGGMMLMAAHAETWPSRPIRWIVPYPPGGGTDLVSRAIAAKLSDYLGQPIVIDNRPGGNTIIGTEVLAQSNPDGYTVALITDAHAINAASDKPLPYDSERDFVPVVQLLRVPLMLIANTELVPEQTLPEVVAHARKDPSWLTFGSLGTGSPHEIAMSWFKTMAKIDILIVPYRGIGPALQDTVAGHVKAMMLGVSVADAQIKAGKVHALAVTSGTRLKSSPTVPTIAEQGFPEYEFVTWYGLVAPRGTPPEIVARLNGEINRALRDPDVQARIGATGGEITGGTSAQLGEIMRRDLPKYRRIFAETGIKLE
ncbi:MAG TPA: tripartite tricarboxylate transporter substrate binding protein [Xanthobacteraceae bacterium]